MLSAVCQELLFRKNMCLHFGVCQPVVYAPTYIIFTRYISASFKSPIEQECVFTYT